MGLPIRYAACLVALLGFLFQPVHGAPAGAILTGGSIDYGCHCEYWVEVVSRDRYRLNMHCNQVGRGIKARGQVVIEGFSEDVFYSPWTDKNSLGKEQSVEFDAPVFKKARMAIVMDTNGLPDMGSCDSKLVEVDQLIRNAWYNSMTCTDISEHLRVRAVLDLPKAIDQRSRWMSTPGTISTASRESWWGTPRAYAEWDLKSPWDQSS